MNHRILASSAVVLVIALAACEEKKKEESPAPAVTASVGTPAANVNATATAAGQPAAAGHPTLAPTTSVATGVAGNGKSVGVNTGAGGSNVNIQNGQKAGTISTTPGNVQIQGAGGGINIPTGGGLPTKTP